MSVSQAQLDAVFDEDAKEHPAWRFFVCIIRPMNILGVDLLMCWEFFRLGWTSR